MSGVALGDVVAGKYELLRVLGAGGMGTVFLARHTELGGYFALKFLTVEGVASPQELGRFRREAQAAAKLKSEHVVRVFDVGKHADALPYMVMEYLEGEDLSRLLLRTGPLPMEQAVDFLLQACRALAEAHREGIIHRDLKPSNLFCVRRAEGGVLLKVVDFGISKLTFQANADAALTGTGAFIGSVGYMSPEQMKSPGNVDARTDIWSLGVVLYECLTGKQPFAGATYPEICLKVYDEPPLRPSVHRPGLAPGLEAVVLKCLEKDPNTRYRTVQELAEDLRVFGGAFNPTTFNPAFSDAGPAAPKKARPAWLQGVLIGALLVVLGGLAVWKRSRSSASIPAPAPTLVEASLPVAPVAPQRVAATPEISVVPLASLSAEWGAGAAPLGPSASATRPRAAEKPRNRELSRGARASGSGVGKASAAPLERDSQSSVWSR